MNRIFILLLLLILSSCSIPERESISHRDLALADMTLEDTELVLGREGENPIRIKADSLALYQRENLALIKGISFFQEDGLEGSAEEAELDIKNEILTLKEEAVIRKPSEKLEIRGSEGIVFDSKNQVVTTQGQVMVKSEDGEFLGEGFYGDLKTESYSFEKITRGVFCL